MFNAIICKLKGHSFGGWKYETFNSCVQVRFCSRDNYEEKQLAPHQFGEWEYIAFDSCKQTRECQRDGFIQHRLAPHQFEEWEYIASDACEQTMLCSRCGQGLTRVNHNWGEWLHPSSRYEQVRTCSRCNQKETENPFSEPESDDEPVKGTECPKSPSGYHNTLISWHGEMCEWCGAINP